MKKILSLLVIGALFLTACGKADKPEKERFIDATVEAACMVFEEGADLTDPNVDWETKTKDVFKKHGFPADDDAIMEEISAKYENDEEVQKAVEDALKVCAKELMEAFGDAFSGEEDGTAVEPAVPAEEEAQPEKK
jgi:hypothetical protein